MASDCRFDLLWKEGHLFCLLVLDMLQKCQKVSNMCLLFYCKLNWYSRTIPDVFDKGTIHSVINDLFVQESILSNIFCNRKGNFYVSQLWDIKRRGASCF